MEALHCCPAVYVRHAREGNKRTQDVNDTLDLALGVSGCDQGHVIHKPRLLSDNGSSYVSGELADGCTAKA